MKIKCKLRIPTKLILFFPMLFIIACTEEIDSARQIDDIYSLSVSNVTRTPEDREEDEGRFPDQVMRLSGVKPGMVVIDLLGGNGYYAELFNPIVGPDGQVILQNNSLFLMFSTEELEKRLSDDRLANVTRLDSEFADLKLPSDVDLIFMGLAYHDIYVPREDPVIMTNREEFFPQIWQALKPGGRFLITDHAAEPGSGISAAPKLHRIAEDYAIEDITAAGFKLIDKLEVMRHDQDDYSLSIWQQKEIRQTDRFVLLFEKPHDP